MRWIALIALILLTGCSSNPLKHKLNQPTYYFDNTLAFQPKRIWRLIVRWEPYLLDAKKAMIVKEFQLVIHDAGERKKLENEIRARGGDRRYLRWLQSELYPTGNWESYQAANIARFTDVITAVVVTKALKEVPQKGKLSVLPVSFPDPLFRAFKDGCNELNWDVIPIGDSVGTEVVLESRDLKPGADKWPRIEHDLPTFSWKAWSVGQERSISYRTVAYVKNNISRCPLPPKIHEELKLLTKVQEFDQGMGIDW